MGTAFLLNYLPDFIILTMIPIIVSSYFFKRRLAANIICVVISVGISILFIWAASYVISDHEMKARLLKVPTTVIVNLGLLNISYSSIKRFKEAREAKKSAHQQGN